MKNKNCKSEEEHFNSIQDKSNIINAFIGVSIIILFIMLCYVYILYYNKKLLDNKLFDINAIHLNLKNAYKSLFVISMVYAVIITTLCFL